MIYSPSSKTYLGVTLYYQKQTILVSYRPYIADANYNEYRACRINQ
ncbi:hypothetical protein LCUFL03_360004 [Latilactobacillus curvatus]|nr:hypothetical protein LCUFL03_360004 [Latilactobacillus curvatus]